MNSDKKWAKLNAIEFISIIQNKNYNVNLNGGSFRIGINNDTKIIAVRREGKGEKVHIVVIVQCTK